MNICGVDKGALTMAKNVLERNDKKDVSDALIESALPIEIVLEIAARDHPDLYMRYVTNVMMINYT